MWEIPFLLAYMLVAFILTFIAIPSYIRFLHRHHLGKKIREEATIGKATEFYNLHKAKGGTPTMGAGIILLVIGFLVIISVLIGAFSDSIAAFYAWMVQTLHLQSMWLPDHIPFSIKFSLWNRQETYISLFTLFTVGLIGLVDDYLNIREIGRTKGLSARVKMILLTVFAGIGSYWFFAKLGHSSVALPFMGNLELGYLYMVVFIFVIITLANSVNITDGLDGLAGGLLLFSYAAYAFIAYQHGLHILAGLICIIIGTLIAFLWFNIKPAKFYMGDVGALSLGANLGVIAMMTDTLVVLVIISLPFLIEMLSSAIQIASKKLRHGKKVFLIAPFHHHLQKLGWSEETIVMRFWLIGIVISSLALIVNAALR